MDRLKETKVMNCGMKATIIEYIDSHNITIKFEDGYIAKNKNYRNFKSGSIRNPNVKSKNSLTKKDRIGESIINNQGINMKIIDYKNGNDIDVIFENDNTVVKNKSYENFKKGRIKNPNFNYYKNIRVGEEKLNNQGCLMKIIDYKTNKDILIEFQDKYKYRTWTQYETFKSGNLKNPYYKSFFNECYLGVTNNNNINKKSYIVWVNMLKRCHDKDFKNKHTTYKECYVCEDWKCYNNFNKWFEENYYEIKDETMDLDKDILFKGNKIYSPDTCIFVPQRINKLFIKSDSLRGSCPIGVSKFKDKFSSNLNKNGNRIFLGYFLTMEEAFYKYKEEKEKYIKEVADEYKDKYKNFPEKLYNAMYNWKIEITD